jgi:branched-chain amino acid transport system permease protein
MGLGSYCAGLLARDAGAGFTLTLVLATLVGGLFGAAICLLTVRLRALFLVIVTVVMAEAVVRVLENTEALGGAVGLYPIPIRTTPAVVYALALAAALLVWWLDRSDWGYRARAVQHDDAVAAALGISVLGVRLQGFMIGGALAGLGGALNIQYTGVIEPVSLGFVASLQIFIYLTIGGMTSWAGPIVGTILLTVLLELLRVADSWRFAVLGVVLLVVILLRPGGIVQRRPMLAPDFARLGRMGRTEAWLRSRLWMP